MSTLSQMPYAKGWHDVRQKPSGKWEARWADETGNARGRSFLTKAQAQKFSLDAATGILNAAVGLSAPSKDIKEAAEAFYLRRVKQETIGIYERHLEDFFTTMPELRITGQLTKDLISKYDSVLESHGHNPGGRRHILKTVKTFCYFCIEKNWLSANPFFKFKMPQQEFEGRALSPEEFLKMISIDPRYEVDVSINRALRFGNPSMLRISQVWKLTPEDFRAPDLVRVEGIKGQDTVWISLHPSALAVLKEMLPDTLPGQRFFAKWPTVDSMRQSLRKKAQRAGLKGIRFHDAAKVTRVTELDAAGFGLGELAELSNTTKATLAKHYIKADRRRVFQRYQTYGRPTQPPFGTENRPLDPTTPTEGTNENASDLKRVSNF